MMTTRADVRGHENLLPGIRPHAEATVNYFRRHRRFLRFVDTRRKWLLLHLIALTCHTECPGMQAGAAANWIAERASRLGIASRNTSLAFFNQLAAYGYLLKTDHRGDRRIKLVALAGQTEIVLADWIGMLVETATGRDVAGLGHETRMRIYLAAVKRLLDDPRWLKAPPDIALTHDMRGGWLAMSEILRLASPEENGQDWIAAPSVSIPAMTETFGLSRSTLYRLVRTSVDAGIMAWEERQSLNRLMINAYHVRQYWRWTVRMLDAAASAYASVAGEAGPAGQTIPRDASVVGPRRLSMVARPAPRDGNLRPNPERQRELEFFQRIRASLDRDSEWPDRCGGSNDEIAVVHIRRFRPPPCGTGLCGG